MTFLLWAAGRGARALVFLAVSAPFLAAQRRPAPEFTQQSILVSNFWVVGTVTPSLTRNDLRFGRKVGDVVRDRLAHLLNKREAKVIDARDVRDALVLASISPDSALSLSDLVAQGEMFRADELVIGPAAAPPKGI